MTPSNFTSFITASRRRGDRALCSAGRGGMLGNADEPIVKGTLVARSAHISAPPPFSWLLCGHWGLQLDSARA
jgi:hypothetical protein